MNVWKRRILLMGICVLFLSSMTVVAETETDGQGDVWRYQWPYVDPEPVGDQPNVDIKEIKAEISGDQITLSMTLWPGGSFSRLENEYAMYVMFYNTSDSYYMLTYGDIIDQEPYGNAMGYLLSGGGMPSMAEVSVNGETINATLDLVGEDTDKESLYGTAWSWERYLIDQYDYDAWFDWVGDYDWNPEYIPDDTDGDNDGEANGNGNGDKDSEGTPGFELLFVITAMIIAFILIRRK